MARKHNTKHRRSPSNYPKRLKKAGFSRAPQMEWTGMSTDEISRAFSKLPHYKWSTVPVLDYDGRKIGTQQIRREIV